MAQIQCPNCGGYKVTEHSNKGCASEVGMHLAFTFITFGLWLIVWIIIVLSESGRPKPDPTLHRYTCQLCGYSWDWKERTPLPEVTVRPDLIAKGVRKLEQEEEERRRRLRED
jgi:hypothetical protein